MIEAIDKISSEKMILPYNDRKLVHTGIRYIYLAQLLLLRPLLIKGADPVAGQNEKCFRNIQACAGRWLPDCFDLDLISFVSPGTRLHYRGRTQFQVLVREKLGFRSRSTASGRVPRSHTVQSL